MWGAPSQPADPSLFWTQVGATVAKYADSNVFKRLAGERAYKEGDYQEGLKTAFLGTDEDILKIDVPELDTFILIIDTLQTRTPCRGSLWLHSCRCPHH